ncbi:MAG TPA: hypothetical protein VMH87_01220 [Pseudomonadales bacterium]|nr:hypothetical protein [Pseudomonadales bacterium]
MDKLSEQLETMLLERHVINAISLISHELFLSTRNIILFIIVSLLSLILLKVGHLNVIDWMVGLLLLLSLWAAPAIGYLILRTRSLNRLKSNFNQPVTYGLNNDGVSVCYSDGPKRELSWSEITKHLKSPEVTVLYAARRKAFIFFPNSILSEKIEAYMLQAISRNLNVPPVITKSARPGPPREKYFMAVMIVVILIIALLLHHHWPPPDLGK